jgi:hypothetical protein
LFYLFNLEERLAASDLLRRINPVVTPVLAASSPDFLNGISRKLTSAWFNHGPATFAVGGSGPSLNGRSLPTGPISGALWCRTLC